MNREPWHTPTYLAQVRTFTVVRELLKIPDGNIVTTGNHPLTYFRLLPKYRCAYSLALRKRVADIVRASRRAA
jgi:hypothetical protein